MTKLADYRSKRRFMRTPEPYGAERPSDPDNLRFVVQQHAATRDHYDLRLELGGVLLSWAIPQGPSVRTKDKRLAIATEDHPLEYATFEGDIPTGEYGAGQIFVWDQGTWVPVTEPAEKAIEAGELKFRLAGEKLGGGWMLKKLRKGKTEWLLIKERDPSAGDRDILAEAPGSVLNQPPREVLGKLAPLPLKLPPQLATKEPAPPDGDGWVHEIKYDGYRTLARLEGDNVKLITRNGHDWTEKYGAVATAFAMLDCEDAFLDGEIIVQDGRGVASFAQLQKALAERRDTELIYYAFDLLHLNGRDLTGEPLLARKELLRRLSPNDPEFRIQYSEHSEANGREFFAQVCRMGLEGVISKRRNAPYRNGRSKEWIKAKRYDVGRFTVVGFTTQASKRHVASLMLAEEDTSPTVYVGRASSGLSNDWASRLFDSLSKLKTDSPSVDIIPPKNVNWIPLGKVTAELSFRGRTGNGYVRQASILSVTDVQPDVRRKVARRTLMTDRDLAAVQLTNPDRAVFEGSNTTKLDIALYYARVGDVMLPELIDRPVTLIRCTTGKIDDCFYQRHAMSGLPEGVEAFSDAEIKEFLVTRNARGLLGLIQFGTIEFHPWDCKADSLDRPDRFTIDLDPGEDVPWPTVAAAAFQLRERLVAVGLAPFVRSTGGKGLHLVVPLAGRQTWDQVKQYIRAFAKAAEKDTPKLFVTNPLIAHRVGRVYVDVNRTNRGSSAVASYSLRARPDFTAAIPLEWAELQQFAKRPVFDRKTAINRVERLGLDPWGDLDEARTTISKKARRAVGLKD